MKKVILSVLASVLSFAFCIFPKSIEARSQYTIDEKYDFPIKTETYEWEQLKSLEEKLVCTQIPNEILNNMTTRALLETWLDYPLSVNIFAYDNVEIGLQKVSEQFNGLEELCKRDDLDAVIESLPSMMSEEDTYRKLLLQVITENRFNDNVETYLNDISTKATSTTYVYTPKGTKVSVTTTDEEWPSSVKALIASNIKKSYPNANLLSAASKKYNCHSYAWYSQSTSNKYWMNNPNAYMTDGSYRRTYTVNTGNKLYYGSGDHSAIVGSTSSQGMVVTSKWGSSGLYSHKYNDCPYSTSNLSYWVR